MNLKRTFNQIRFLYKIGGLPKLMDFVRENLVFDLKRGTSTWTWLPKKEFKPVQNLDHGVRYRASYTSQIKQSFRQASKILPDSDFYDMGCGKGKVLILAEESGLFRSISGIDYYKDFVNTAKQNLEVCKMMDVKVHHADAMQFKGYKKRSVVYMYNPFGEEIMSAVKDNIAAYSEEAIVIYNKPVEQHLFNDDPDWVTLAHDEHTNEDRETILYYFGSRKEAIQSSLSL